MFSHDNVINLEDFRVRNGDKISKVFTGRDRGKYVRETSNIDVIAEENENVKIIIPENVYSINPSFFEELFVNVVTKLGKEGFLKKFSFESQGDYQYEKPLYEAIDRILRTKSAIE